MLERLAIQLQAARISNNYQQALNIVTRSSQIANLYEIGPTERARVTASLERIDSITKDFLPAIRIRNLVVQDPSGVPRSVEAFAEKTSVKNGVAPTDALIIDSAVGGKHGLGLMESYPDRPGEEIVLNFTAQMTIDPWLRQRVEEKLKEQGEELEGLFSKWSLTPRKIDFEGINGEKSTVTVVGDKLVCRLVFDAKKGNLAFYQLTQGVGLPVSFDWVYKDDPKFKGEWEGVRLSFARRERPELVLSGARVSNRARVPVTIYYCQAGEKFVSLNPALRVEPQSEAALALPAETDPQKLVIPPEAVAYNVDPDSYRNDFYLITGDELVERVTITNLLPPGDQARLDDLRYVEVKLSYTLGDGATAKEVTLGPVHLASKGSLGSEVTLPFLRAKSGNVSFTLSGTAYYGRESSQTLKTQTVTGLTVKISQDSL